MTCHQILPLDIQFFCEIVSFLETTPGYRNSDEEFILQFKTVFSETGGLKSEIVNLELSGNDSSQENNVNWMGVNLTCNLHFIKIK